MSYSHEKYVKENKRTKEHNDWRLPTIKELISLINDKKHSPACDFTDTHSCFYWSSTSCAIFIDGALSVDFRDGYTGNISKTYSLYVRCVRDGKKGLHWSKTSEDRMTWNEATKYARNLVAKTYCKGVNNEKLKLQASAS